MTAASKSAHRASIHDHCHQQHRLAFWPTIMLTLSGSLSALMVGALLAARRMDGPILEIVHHLCSHWSMGIQGLGELITGTLVANLLLFICVAVTGLIAIIAHAIRLRQSARSAPTSSPTTSASLPKAA